VLLLAVFANVIESVEVTITALSTVLCDNGFVDIELELGEVVVESAIVKSCVDAAAMVELVPGADDSL